MTLSEAASRLQHVVIYRPPDRPHEYGSIAGVTKDAVLVKFEGCTLLQAARPEDLTLLSKVGQ